MIKSKVCFKWFLIISIFFGLYHSCYLFAEEPKWSVGYITGYYDPSLKTLNKIIGDRRIAIFQDPNFLMPGNVTDDNRGLRNIPISELRPGIFYGVETQWRINSKSSFLFTMSTWDGVSIGNDIYQIPVLTLAETVDAPRSARYNLIINQYWLGLKYNVFNNNKGEFFCNLELLGLSISYLTIDSLTKVIAPEFDLNFVSISSTEASGLGYTTRFGFGGEYFFTKWLSMDIRFNYILGKVIRLKIVRYFPPNFPPVIDIPDQAGNVQPEPPKQPQTGDVIIFGADTSTNVTRTLVETQDLTLELNGPELTTSIKFYF